MLKNALALSGVVIKELYRRKDFYVLFVLTVLLTVMLASVSFFKEERIVRYVKEICLLLIWVSSLVIGITTAARQIPAEKENRTLFPLLAKPVTRGNLVFGKFLGCWFACGLALLVFYLFFVVVSGSREHQWPLVGYFQALWLHWIFLAVVVAMSLLGSVVFAAPSSNSTILFVVIAGILLVGRHLNQIALQLPTVSSTLVYTIYYLIPHLEFYDVRDLVIHNLRTVPWMACILATLYGFSYTGIFLFLTWLVFRRKALN